MDIHEFDIKQQIHYSKVPLVPLTTLSKKKKKEKKERRVGRVRVSSKSRAYADDGVAPINL